MRPAFLLVLGACTFTPPDISGLDAADPRKDGEVQGDADPSDVPLEDRSIEDAHTDAGDAGDLDAGGPDAGDDAGQGNRPPIILTLTTLGGLPWDTFQLDASSSDPDRDPLAFAWTLVSLPAGSIGGFAPFPVTSTSSQPIARFYGDRPGSFVVRLEVSDGELTSTATVTITVSSFTPIPPPPGEGAETVKALDVDPSNGRVYLGTMIGGQYFDPPASTTAIACITNDKTNDVEVRPLGGLALYAFDDSPNPVTATGTTCESLMVPAGAFTKINAIRFVPAVGQVFFATDEDLYFGSSVTALMEQVFDAAGPNKKYGSLAVDAAGELWIGGGEAMVDGAIRTPLPPVASARLHTFFGGDDKVRALAGSLGTPSVREMWIVADVGIAHVPDIATPDVFTVYTPAAGNWPVGINEKGRAIAYDRATGDVFIAVETGLARYKRDAGVFVSLTGATCGYSGDLRDIAVDPRNRRIFLGTMDGGFWIE